MANPYAPPQAPPPFTPVGVGPGGALKWVYVLGYGVFWLFMLMGYGIIGLTGGLEGSEPQGAGAIVGAVIVCVGFFALLAAPIAAVVWLYQSWSSVPPEMRYTNGGTWMTPGKAIGFLFIPFFNLVWLFIANLGLCDAVNRTLVARGGPPRAPRGIALAACIAQVVPYCNFLVAPILWSVYMFQMDAARNEMSARLQGG